MESLPSSKVVYIVVTADTKGVEADFIRRKLHDSGVGVRLMDVGSYGDPTAKPDITRDEVFAAVGTSPEAVKVRGDRNEAVAHAREGARKLVLAAHQNGELAGVIGLGGSAGTLIGTTVMQALPLGVPKLMVSTIASGQVRSYVGVKDILMMNAVVDISGINRISRKVLTQAANAMIGMVNDEASAEDLSSDRPIVALTMFGVTTACVEHARKVIDDAGYETLVFHATGGGGKALESLIREGEIAAVLDLTTTELADELVGGFLSAGPERLTAAGARGIPQVVSVGATDMVNFYARDTVPPQFAARQFYQHDAQVTLMRTTEEENRAIGTEIGRKAAGARGPVAILLPKQGVSAYDRAGKPFDDPKARQALFDGVGAAAGDVPVEELDHHINDPAFAEAAANKLLAMLKETKERG